MPVSVFSILTVFATSPWFGLVWLELGSDGRGTGLWAAIINGPGLPGQKNGPVEQSNRNTNPKKSVAEL